MPTRLWESITVGRCTWNCIRTSWRDWLKLLKHKGSNSVWSNENTTGQASITRMRTSSTNFSPHSGKSVTKSRSSSSKRARQVTFTRSRLYSNWTITFSSRSMWFYRKKSNWWEKANKRTTRIWILPYKKYLWCSLLSNKSSPTSLHHHIVRWYYKAVSVRSFTANKPNLQPHCTFTCVWNKSPCNKW